MKTFKNGEKVWVYKTGLRPVFGTVTGKMDKIDSYYVQTEEKRPSEHAHYVGYLFREDQLERMFCTMELDSSNILRYILETKKEIENRHEQQVTGA